MNFPAVKGWIPFKGTENQCKEANVNTGKLKRKRVDDEEDDSDKVEIPLDWKPEAFKIEDNPHKRLFAVSEFKVLYPKALDSYLKEVFPLVQKALQEHFIRAEMNRLDGELLVRTTPKTFDPVMIIRANSVIRVLARFVPVEDSLTLLGDDKFDDIISIGHRNKDTFIRRKNRIEEAAIKDLVQEVLGCKIYVSGKSVAAIGGYEALYKVRKFVEDCFERNIHPIYHLKRFQIMNKLAVMPDMANQDWTNYLPPLPKKKNVKTKVPHKVREKKKYTPFAPPNAESKIDKELASGVFHLKYEKKDGSNHFKLKDSAKQGDKKNAAKKQKLDDEI